MTAIARPPSRILVLVGGTVALACGAILASWSSPPTSAFWFWLVACLVGELLWVRLPVGQATISMGACFQFAMLLTLARGHAMLVTVLSGVIAELVIMRKPAIRAVFNGGQAALAVGAASLVAAWSGGSKSATELIRSFQLVPLITAAAVYFVVNTGAVSIAVALNERIPVWWAWRANFGGRFELISNGALMSLGVLLADHYARHGLGGTLLLVLPLLVAHEGYRRFHRRRGSPPEDSERQAA